MRRGNNNNLIWRGFIGYGTFKGIGTTLSFGFLLFTLPIRVLRWLVRSYQKSSNTRRRVQRRH